MKKKEISTTEEQRLFAMKKKDSKQNKSQYKKIDTRDKHTNARSKAFTISCMSVEWNINFKFIS